MKLAENFLNNSLLINMDKPLPRRTIELDVVEHSFELLDNILLTENIKLISIVEAGYIAASRIYYKRLGEAITLIWTACEQLISLLWLEMIDESKNRESNPSTVNKDRLEKLKGRDYPASVKIELLELNSKISGEIYQLLSIGRKARNDWVHEMKIPEARTVHKSIDALQKLLHETKGINVNFSIFGRGGVPKWPIWSFEEVYNEPFKNEVE